MASQITSTAGQVQALKIAWTPADLPRHGDHLTCRNGRGGWVILSVRRLADDPTMALLQGRRFDAPGPALARGATIWPWTATAAPTAAPLPAALLQDVRPVSITTLAQINTRAKELRDREAAAAAAPPLRSAPREWADPDDRLRTRTPRVVRGRRRCDAINRLAKQEGTSVTKDMVAAMEAVKCSYDIAITPCGLSGGSTFGEANGPASRGPITGPSSAAQRTLEHTRRIARLAAALGSAGWAQLRFCILDNHGLPAYCAANVNAAGRPMARGIAMGRLLQTLDRVVEWSDDNAHDAERHASA